MQVGVQALYNFTFPFSWSVRFPLNEVLLAYLDLPHTSSIFSSDVCHSGTDPNAMLGSDIARFSHDFLAGSRVSSNSLAAFYVGIRQARMAAIAGIRPSITTNAITIGMMAAILF